MEKDYKPAFDVVPLSEIIDMEFKENVIVDAEGYKRCAKCRSIYITDDNNEVICAYCPDCGAKILEQVDTEVEEKAKQASREYQRKWRKEHREQVKEYNRRYWARKAQGGEAK